MQKIPQIARLLEYIKNNYKSKSEFARKIGITPADLSKYIARNKIPGGVFLKRLSDAGVDINYIMNGTKTQAIELPIIYGVSAGPLHHIYDDIKDNLNLSFLTKDSVIAVKVKGYSMVNANIDNGDIIIVDKKAPIKENKIVLVAEETNMTVKRLTKDGLKPENDIYDTIPLSKAMNIIGVVTHIIKKVK